MSSRRRSVGVLGASLCLGSGLVWAAPRGVPDWIISERSDRQAPAWVSATRAAPAGAVEWELFTDAEKTALQGYLRNARARVPDGDRFTEKGAAAGCTLWLGAQIVDWEDPRPHAGLDDLVAHAQAIYRGTITDVRQGFYYGEPGSLVEVAVEQSWKAPLPEQVLVFYPHAVIPLQDGAICKRGPRHPVVPQAGGDLLVFSYRTVAEESGSVIYPDDEELFFTDPAGGGLSVPERFARETDPEFRLQDLEERVVSLLTTGVMPQKER